jgi:hypothetical protein
MDGTHGKGCITFVANGSGAVWPEFLEFVEDNLGASIVPCGWFTYESAGVPGWTGTSAPSGDGSCLLPDGGNNTTAPGWTTFLGNLGTNAWDPFIKLDLNWPAPQPKVQWSMVGSGPYYAAVTAGLSYALAANPAYVQPSGCSGAAGLAVYVGYCDPAPGKYIANIDVTWETQKEGDSLGTDAIEAGTADFAGIYTTQTTTLLGYVHSGLWQYILFPTLSDAFTPINLAIDYSAYNTTFAGTPLESNPINPSLFTDIGLRNFYVNTYPYTTIENTINTVDGLQFLFNAGGPVPVGMGNYYPSNVSWPYLLGDPTQSSSVVGSAAWWWAQLTNVSSPYYNATLLAKCTPGNPCTWPIGYFDGAPANLPLIDDWAGEIYALSGHRLSPWPLALTFTQFLSDTLIGAYESPLASVVGFGWAPDYPDPTDYFAPIAQPNGGYTAPDTFNAQLALPQYENNATCGHYGISTPASAYANLTYWAHQARNPSLGTLTSACQGVAYNVSSYWMSVAGAMPDGPQRVLDYNLIEQITNALAMYIYNGQSNQLVGFAPWIDPASVNTNPVIGGGGDIVWYQIHYRSIYGVTVSESGLPSGTSWSATLGGATSTTTSTAISFTAQPNGSYNYSVGFVPGYSVSPSNGTVAISGGTVTKTVTFAPISGATTKVYFNETGLVTGTSWSLLVQGYGAISSTSPTIVFSLPVSTSYPYRALDVLGYFAPASGTVVVGTGTSYVTVPYVGFFGATYLVTFTEYGLSSGTSWSVTVGLGSTPYTLSSTGSTISFYEFNGSVNWTVSGGGGYSPLTASGSATVSGAATDVVIVFQKGGPAWTYLSPLAYGIIGALAVLTIAGFAMAARARGRKPTAAPPETWAGGVPPDEAAATPPPQEPTPPTT